LKTDEGSLSPSACPSHGKTAEVSAAADARRIPLLSTKATSRSTLSALTSHLAVLKGLFSGLASPNKFLHPVPFEFAEEMLGLRTNFMTVQVCVAEYAGQLSGSKSHPSAQNDSKLL